MTKRNPKFDALLAKHATTLLQLHRNLAMNFNVPSRDLMQMAAAEMRISVRVLEAIEEYRIARWQYYKETRAK